MTAYRKCIKLYELKTSKRQAIVGSKEILKNFLSIIVIRIVCQTMDLTTDLVQFYHKRSLVHNKIMHDK